MFMGGVQVGYDHQFSPNWVLGIEANYSFLDTNNNPFVNRGLGSVTGRVGYSWGPALLVLPERFRFPPVSYDSTAVGAN